MTGFDGQNVIVTGAASGIGFGIAREVHDAGASVVLGDVGQDAVDQARATFSDQRCLAFVRVDVRDQLAVASLDTTAEQAFGPPSVVIANAGIVPNASGLDMVKHGTRGECHTSPTADQDQEGRGDERRDDTRHRSPR